MKFSLNLKEIRFTIPFKQAEIAVGVNSRMQRLLMAVLALISLGAWIFYYNQGLILAYNDARSRLNIARRVVDSLQPGFAQIGSVWLPLYHILELPLIWNDYFWQSGIAGSVVSMVAFILGGWYLIKLAKLLKFDLWALILSFLVYALNPNLLFMQAIPMTESLLIFLSIATVYYVVKWAIDSNPSSLIGAAFFTFLSTLTRYDGWFLLIFAVAAVAVIAFKRKGYKFAEGNTILYITLAAFGVILWFGWNWLIFKDPFYFALGPFSAKAQQDILEAEGRLLTKGNPVYSFFLYILAVKENMGMWVGLLGLVGIWLFLKSKKYSAEVKIAAGLLSVPFLFNVASLIAGHSVIHLPELPPYTWFNDRYGLMVLPLFAIAIGFIARRRKTAFVLATLILLIQNYLMYSENKIITIEDGVKGASGDFLNSAGAWIKENSKNGLILVAASSNDALLFKAGLPLKRYITEGVRLYWQQALVDPTINAEWIIMHKGDLVYKNLIENPLFLENYRLVYKDEFSYIYQKDENREGVLTSGELP